MRYSTIFGIECVQEFLSKNGLDFPVVEIKSFYRCRESCLWVPKSISREKVLRGVNSTIEKDIQLLSKCRSYGIQLLVSGQNSLQVKVVCRADIDLADKKRLHCFSTPEETQKIANLSTKKFGVLVQINQFIQSLRTRKTESVA